ncbi:hypothetical protein V1264_004116 [Littorina saxatilis]|uniref:Uncharacterized protein n=1 Tax=Littorina saxatilis TaxID=31220 RepID=A0AAN9B3E8_9CAEN
MWCELDPFGFDERTPFNKGNTAVSTTTLGRGCSSVGSALDLYPVGRCQREFVPTFGERFISQSQLCVQIDSPRCPNTPVCTRKHKTKCAQKRSCNPCQSSVGSRNTKIPSMLPPKAAYGCLNGGVKTVIHVKAVGVSAHERTNKPQFTFMQDPSLQRDQDTSD